jgi:hypothetical protein
MISLRKCLGSKQESRGVYNFNIIRNSTYLSLKNEIEQMNMEVQKIRSIRLLGQFVHENQEITLDYAVVLKKSFVNMQKYLTDNDGAVLIINESESANKVINLTGVYPYIILFFDNDLNFKAVTYSLESGKGEFRLTTQFKYHLFLRFPLDFELIKIRHLCLD